MTTAIETQRTDLTATEWLSTFVGESDTVAILVTERDFSALWNAPRHPMIVKGVRRDWKRADDGLRVPDVWHSIRWNGHTVMVGSKRAVLLAD